MNRGAWIALLALPCWAHVMSISSGDLIVEGRQAHYQLRMPQYELTHIQNPDRSLLEHIRFSSHGQTARLLSKSCAPDSGSDAYVCGAEYEFPEAPDQIDVECTLASDTVPNHIHLLRSEMKGRNDQAVFDLAFPRATLRFRLPTPLEVAATQTGAGVVR